MEKVSVIVKRNGFALPKKKIVFNPEKTPWDRFCKIASEKTNCPFIGEIFDAEGNLLEGIDEIEDGTTIYVGTCGSLQPEKADLDYRKCILFHKKRSDPYYFIDLGDSTKVSKIKAIDMIKKRIGAPGADVDVFREDGKKVHYIEDDDLISAPVNLKLVIESDDSSEATAEAAAHNAGDFLDSASDYSSVTGSQITKSEVDFDNLSLHSAGSSNFYGTKRDTENLMKHVLSTQEFGSLEEAPSKAVDALSWYTTADGLKENQIIPIEDTINLLRKIFEDVKGRQFLFEFAKKLEAFKHIDFMKLYIIFQAEPSFEVAEVLYHFVVEELDVKASVRNVLTSKFQTLADSKGDIEIPSDFFEDAYHHEIDFFRRTILPSFLSSSFFESVKITLGMNLTRKDRKDFNTPVHVAIRDNDFKLLSDLVARRYCINIGNKFGDTPLHFAVRLTKKDAVEKLIQNGSYLDCKNISGNTPLLVAINNSKNKKSRAIVAILLKAGADTKIPNNNGQTALMLSPNKKTSLIISASLGGDMMKKLKKSYENYKEFLVWDISLSVNVDYFDDEHKQIIAAVNVLYNAISNKERVSVVSDIFDKFIPVAMRHFSDEETTLSFIDYPNKKSHFKAHGVIRRGLRNAQKEFQAGKNVGLKALEVIKDWFINHILVEDTQYGEYLRNVDVKSICE